MRKFECQKMGGRWNGRPGQRSWTDCHLDWCQIPRGRKRKEMDRLPYRQNFLNDRNSKICYHSLKDHPKVSKIAKFRCEML